MNGSNKKGDRILLIIGIVLLVLGVICLILKGFTPESIDAEGILHEAFFLLPLGFGGIFAGCVVLIISGIRAFFHKKK